MRAWVLLGLERWNEAAEALSFARQKDPANAKLASILPAVQAMGTVADAERWKSDATRSVFGYLQEIDANGPALAFGAKLKLNGQERVKLANPRLLAALGKGNYSFEGGNDGLIGVNINGRPIRSLEAFRGLPIDRLGAAKSLIVDLEPLRGIHLQSLSIDETNVSSLVPLSVCRCVS